MRNELIGSGLSICSAYYIFYAINPIAQRMILVEKLLKITVYCLVLLGFNLWMRVMNRLKGIDVESDAAIKEHIKMSMFFLAMFAVMDLALTISQL